MTTEETYAIERLKVCTEMAFASEDSHVTFFRDDAVTLLAEVERLRAERDRFEQFWKDSEAECRAVQGRLDVALAEREALSLLHREAHAIFSWSSGLRYEDPCPECHGAPGVHACGCWGDEQVEYVCAECHRLGGAAAGLWPCATAAAALLSAGSAATR